MIPPTPPPNPPTPPDQAAALDAYLDGTLDGADLAAFEAALAADPVLRAEVDLQRRIDGSLRRRFTPPASLEPRAPVGGVTQPPRRYWNLPRLLAAAAIVLLVGGVTVGALTMYFARQHPLVRVYRAEVARGLKPDWVCDTDEQLIAYLEDKYGAGLTVRPSPEVQLIGWTSSAAISPYTAVLMTRVEGEPVLVLVDRRDADRGLQLPWLSGLNLFRREVGGMVLYELTPRDEPALLERFAQPPPTG